MDNGYLLIETTPDAKWDKFIKDSPNSTIFATSAYLTASRAKFKLFYCFNKEELRAAAVVMEDTENANNLNDFIIYNGIMYNKPTNKQNHSQQLSEQFNIQEFIACELIKNYDKINMVLHPTIVDIRAFLWVNYAKDLPKYTASIRYTSYVDISDFRNASKLEDISIYNKASVSRRQQIRYALKKMYKTKITNDVLLFVEFYKKTMQRQNIALEQEFIDAMKELSVALIKAGMAKIYASYDELDEVGSMALFGWDNKRAYYIFGANDPDKRNGHSGTNVLWCAFFDLNSMGINEVDLEGINSPKRGWFKLSFGGSVVPYFEVKFKGCNNANK